MNRKQQRCSNMQAFQDVDVEITRILQKDMTAGSPLLPETTYQIFCIAEDDWKEQASKMTRDGKGEKASERERERDRERERVRQRERERGSISRTLRSRGGQCQFFYRVRVASRLLVQLRLTMLANSCADTKHYS